MQTPMDSITVPNPINFSNDIDIQIHPLDPITQQPTGRFYSHKQHRSWEWICNAYRVIDPAYFDECEECLKERLRVNLAHSGILRRFFFS
jgi:hypothetical protein